MGHPLIHTPRIIEPESVIELRAFVREHGTPSPPAAAEEGEINVLLAPDEALHNLMSDLSVHICQLADSLWLDAHVVWHGSIREWQPGEYATSHFDCYDVNDGAPVLMDGLQQRYCDLSCVLFLSDSEGDGILQFPEQGVDIKPVAGTAALFPATIPHQVSTVEKERLTMVFFLSRARTLGLTAPILPDGWQNQLYHPSRAEFLAQTLG
jgi:hypothetical protein